MCINFEKEGKENTDETVKIALERAAELGIKKVVVASNTGETAMVVLDAVGGKGIDVIVVGHQYGLREPDVNPMSDEMQEKIRKAGGRIQFATHALKVLGGMASCDGAQAAATSLKMFCQGVKVCVEIALMSADAGLVHSKEEIVCIAGTGRGGRGADTACVIQPTSTTFAWDREKGLRIRELLCKPR
jgi:hypothetical protein